MTSTEQRGVPEGLQPSPAGPQDSLWGASIALHSGSQEGSSKYSPQQPPPPAPFHLAAECKAGFDTWPRSFMLTRSPAGNVPPSWNSGQTDLCHRTVGCRIALEKLDSVPPPALVDATFLPCACIAAASALGHVTAAVGPASTRMEWEWLLSRQVRCPWPPSSMMYSAGKPPWGWREVGGTDRQLCIFHARKGCSSRRDK